MAFCLPKEFSENFLAALRSGKIVPEQLVVMTSAQRRAFFEDIVGPNAMEVNALFESKMLLRDYKAGLVTWAKQVAGLKQTDRRDLISRIEKFHRILNPLEEQAFLADLAALKLGTKVSLEEARDIVEFSSKVQEFRSKWDSSKSEVELAKDPTNLNAGWSSPEARLSYGLALSDFRSYLADLKNTNASVSIKEILQRPLYHAGQGIYKSLGITKALLASLDNSFFGRQGIKVLFTHPAVWARNFKKSFGDIAKTITGGDAMRLIEADVFSRPNAMNNKYRNTKLDIGIDFEEPFPATAQQHIIGIGRFFKAADVAFTGAAMRVRADIADRIIPLAEEFGINTNNPAEAPAVGYLINSMTGRGAWDSHRGAFINVAFFSIRFLKSNFDTLTLHALDPAVRRLQPQARTFVRRRAALNILRIVMAEAFILYMANTLFPGVTEFDPRSSKFGKLVFNKTSIDITGGLASMVTLASRLVPTLHNGKWSFWYKTSDGKYLDLLEGKYGQLTPLDVFDNFFQGKLSPAFALVRDIWKNENFQGEKPNIINSVTNLVNPLPIQTYFELKNNPNSMPILLGMMADVFGFSTYTPPPKK